MVTEQQKAKAEQLLALHTAGRLLILPNVWDPAGARILESMGYPAVATASAAIAESLGYSDGENLRLDTMLEVVARIAGSVEVPVSADLEGGYAVTPEELQETIGRLLETGAVGVNLEDSLGDGHRLRPVAEQCQRLAAAREAADQHGVHLVINARVDSFFSESLATPQAKVEDAVMRARAYIETGADCIYPIGPGDQETLGSLRQHIPAPLNVLASPQAIGLPELQALGINRVSFGPYIFRSCMGKFRSLAGQLKDHGGYDLFSGDFLSGMEMGRFLRPGKEPQHLRAKSLADRHPIGERKG